MLNFSRHVSHTHGHRNNCDTEQGENLLQNYDFQQKSAWIVLLHDIYSKWLQYKATIVSESLSNFQPVYKTWYSPSGYKK